MLALENSLTCRLIANDLFTCDGHPGDGIAADGTPREELTEIAQRTGYSCIPLYVLREALKPPYWIVRLFLYNREDQSHEIVEVDSNHIVADNTPISDLIRLFDVPEFFLVLEKNRLMKIVTVADLDSFPVRVFIITLISHLEGALSEAISTIFPNNSWESSLNENQNKRIAELFEKKQMADFDTKLIDCTTLTDKLVIISKIEKTPILFTNKAFNELKKNVLRIRNRLSHNQPPVPVNSSQLDMQSNDKDDEGDMETLRNHTLHSQILVNRSDVKWLCKTIGSIEQLIENLDSLPVTGAK